MELRDWRIGKGWSQGQLGEALGFPPDSRASQAERIENGKIKVDADLGEAICHLTGGEVTTADLQKTRLDWLKANGRARSFPAVPADPIPVPSE